MSGQHLPWQRFTRAQGFEFGLAKSKGLGRCPTLALQRDLALVAGQVIEVRAVKACKSLQLVQRTRVVNDLGVCPLYPSDAADE